MVDLKQEKEQLVKKANSWLSGKAYWVWLLAYTAVVGVIFALFYTATRILTYKWWAAIIIIFLTGLIWSWILYNKTNRKKM